MALSLQIRHWPNGNGTIPCGIVADVYSERKQKYSRKLSDGKQKCICESSNGTQNMYLNDRMEHKICI